MKKQILILTIFTLALFAGTSKSYGQIIADGNPNPYVNVLSNAPSTCASVTQLTCASGIDALHPQAGISYTYDVTTSTPSSDRIHWFVTDNSNIIAVINDITGASISPVGGSYILDATSGVYDVPTQTQNTINIKWKAFDGSTNVVLLVAYVVDAAGCTDNIEVYRIMPQLNFTLDIDALADDGTIPATAEECASPVESATYTAGSAVGNGDLAVDYGENWLFFTVTAANFTHSWLPSFTAAYTGSVSDAITIDWALSANANSTNAADWHATTLNAGVYTSTDPVTDQSGTGADDGTGQCIVVRVRIDHGTVDQNLTSTALTLAVNGTMFDPAATSGNEYSNSAYDDLGEDTVGNDGICDAVDFDDHKDFTITPRPTITSNTPASSTDNTIQNFEPKN